MAFEQVLGQDKIKEILALSLKRKRIPHAMLFHGMDGIGKEALALELAKALICTKDQDLYCNECHDCTRISQLSHPDVFFIYPAPAKAADKDIQEINKSIVKNPYLRAKPWANPTISIDRIRELKKVSSLSSLENKGRVVIIAEAHRMTIEATNSLLKILEEPPEKMYIILTSSQLNSLLPTIVSRCQLLRLLPLTWQEIETALQEKANLNPDQAQLIAKLSSGSFRRAMELLDEELDEKRDKVLDVLRKVIRGDLDRILLVEELVRQEDKKSLKDYLELMLLWFRDAMVYSTGQNNDLIVNIDKLQILERFCTSFSAINYEKIVSEIEYAIELFDRNVYLNLIMINLFYVLKQQLRRKNG